MVLFCLFFSIKKKRVFDEKDSSQLLSVVHHKKTHEAYDVYNTTTLHYITLHCISLHDVLAR